MKVIIVVLLLLVGVSFAAGAKPRIIVLANSIDSELASDFYRFLGNQGMEVVNSNASDFDQYKSEKFIVILGGPDAPEGVGEIVKGVLSESEQNILREQGSRRKYVRTNPWGLNNGQRVTILAGSDRSQTKKSHEENQDDVILEAEEADLEEALEMQTQGANDTAPNGTAPSYNISQLSNAAVVIFRVIYDPDGEEPADEKIILKNTASEDVDISGWVLTDGEGSYTIPDGTVITPEEVWAVYGATYNPTGYAEGMLLNNEHDSVTLKNRAGETVGTTSW